MYGGVDIGGSKVLVAALDSDGVIVEQTKFPTPKDYNQFLAQLANTLAGFKNQDFQAAGVAVPGRINREHGTLIELSNLSWHNEPIQADTQKIFDCPIVIENDANLAALSESKLQPNIDTILYVTVSTGIGTGVVYRQQLDTALLDSEGGHLLIAHHGQLKTWESFASGKAIYEHFGKPASELRDQDDWRLIARNLALGLFENIAVVQPDLIIIGGSVGRYFDHYSKYLTEELVQYRVPVVPIPPLLAAQRPEEAVIYGCYDLAKQVYGNRT